METPRIVGKGSKRGKARTEKREAEREQKVTRRGGGSKRMVMRKVLGDELRR